MRMNAQTEEQHRQMLADISRRMVGHKQATDELTMTWKERFEKSQADLRDVQGMERLNAFSVIMVCTL